MKQTPPADVSIEDYVPYGKEWEKEMSKFSKLMLIQLLKEQFTKQEAAGYAAANQPQPNESIEEKSEVWWDEFSEMIDTDIDSLQYWAGRVVMDEPSYKKLIQKVKAAAAKDGQADWMSVKERPLFTEDEKGNWTCTDDGNKEFFAAVPYNDKTKPDKNLWWIRHCVIEDSGLCVVGDDDNEPAGWSLDDVTHWMPLPLPPGESSTANEVDVVEFIKKNTKYMKSAIKLIEAKQIASSSTESEIIENPNGELIKGAIVILSPEYTDLNDFPAHWDKGWCKCVINKTWVERLVIAGSLIAAEIDRINKQAEVNL